MQSITMRPMRALATLAVSVVAVGLALLVCELGLRLLDGQPLWQLTLPPARTVAPPTAVGLDPQIGGALPAEIDPLWIDAEPPPFPKPPTDFRLEKRARLWSDPTTKWYETFRIWNRSMVRSLACRPESIFQRLPQPLLVFDSPDRRVPYRYLPSRTLPGGLMTNRFGWRGPDLPLDKPLQTVRLAFVGASTTVGLWGMPFSYPEYVVHWLNLWAARAGFAVRFDGINAGREGIDSGSIAGVTRDEVLPLEPDMVVYYEGANQSLCMHRVVVPRPPAPSSVRQAVDERIRQARPYLQTARRLAELLQRIDARDGMEPVKPAMKDTWFPAGLDKARPDVSREENLPTAERKILQDLEELRDQLASDGSTLVLSSFVWLVHDGLRLDPLRNGNIYRWLNQECWPHTYRDLRRAADLHNRVLQHYAATKGVPFIDVAAGFPNDPDLFTDGVHLNHEGTKVQAWLALRALVPLVRARLESGAWPRPDRMPLAEHPNIKPPELYRLRCDAPPTEPPRPTATPRDDGFL
jgi:hypothetical protein